MLIFIKEKYKFGFFLFIQNFNKKVYITIDI